MSESYRNQDGVSIRLIHLLMIVSILIVMALLGFFSYSSITGFSDLSRETGNYIVRQEAAHSLMEASDYLTEMVQRFTMDGDTTYLDNYFEEAFMSKRREASILTMSKNEAEEVLVVQLQEAMEESQSLMYREYYAMKLVLEAMEIRDYPEVLRAIELKEEDAFLPAEEKMTLAQDMVLGSEYYANKEVIRDKLRSSLDTLNQMINATRQESQAQMLRNLARERVAIIAMMAFLLFQLMLIYYTCVRPLMVAVRSAECQAEIPLMGTKEFRYMADLYNKKSRECDSARTDSKTSGQGAKEASEV